MTGSAQKTYLGLDIGTSSVKALLIDAEQRVVAEASPSLTVSRPHPLWSEQDPDDWVRGVEAGVAAIRAAGARGVCGARRDRPFRPDARRDAARRRRQAAPPGDPVERRPLVRRMRRAEAPRAPTSRSITGNLAMPGFTAPKMLWVAAHEPEIAKATKRVLLPKDYVRLRLSGEAVSEMSDAAGTSWLDVGKRRWDESLLAATGLTLSAMPRLVEGSEVSAHLVARRRQRLGARGPGDPDRGRRRRQRGLRHRRRRDRGGLGLRLARHLGRDLLGHRPLRQPARAHAARLLPCAAEPLARHGGDAVGRRVARLDRRAFSGARTRSARWSPRLRAFARSKAAVAAAPVFLPYLSGERTPHNDAEATGMFAGLRASHARRRAGVCGDGGRRLFLRRRRSTCSTRRARGRCGRCWSAAARAPTSGAR